MITAAAQIQLVDSASVGAAEIADQLLFRLQRDSLVLYLNRDPKFGSRAKAVAFRKRRGSRTIKKDLNP